MHACTHWGGAHTDNESAHHFDSEKLINFSCGPDGIRTSGHEIHWISRPTLYQLSHHVPHFYYYISCCKELIHVYAKDIVVVLLFQNLTCVFCAAEAGKSALESEAKPNEIGGIERKSTRLWALSTGYDPEKLFNKVIPCCSLVPLLFECLFVCLLLCCSPLLFLRRSLVCF